MEENGNVLTLQDEAIIRAIATLQKASRKAERLIDIYRPVLNGERLLTDAELSEILKVSRRTLQEYRNDGILPYIEMKGKCLYRESDVERVLMRYYKRGLSQTNSQH